MAAPRVPRDAAPATVAKKAAARAAARKAATPDSPKSPTAEGEGAGAGAGGADGSPTVGDGEAIGGPASKRVLRSQGRRTMRKLLDAAMIAFDQRGYYDTRVNDVVEIAETSHGTFYLYFSNKEDLLRALVTEAGVDAQLLADTLHAPTELDGSPQWEDVHGWISAYSELWVRYAPLFRAWTDLATIDPGLIEMLQQTLGLMNEALARQIGAATSGRTIDAASASMAVLAMLDRFHYLREFVGQPVDDVALDTLTTMVHRALFNGSASATAQASASASASASATPEPSA